MENVSTIKFAVQICAGISLLCIIFSLLVYLKFKSRLPVFYSFVAVIQISAGLSCSMVFIPNTIGQFCLVQGYFNTFGALSAVTWSAILAEKFYAWHVYEEEISKRMVLYTCLAFGLSAVLAALPMITNSYVSIEGYCCIGGDKRIIWRALAYYSLILVCIVFTFWRYNQLIKEIKLDMQNIPDSSVLSSRKNSSFRRMRMYSVILLLCFGPSISYLILDALNSGGEKFELVCMCFEGLFGMMNTFVFVLKQDIIELIGNHLLCKKDKKESMSRFLTMDDEAEGSVLREISN